MNLIQSDRSAASLHGMLVLATAEILREPLSEVRELALLNIMEYTRNPQFSDVSFTQVYLTAKVLVDDTDSTASSIDIQVKPVLAECRKLLEEVFPQFKERPNVQQMLSVLKLMNSTRDEFQSTRKITASDMLGLDATAPQDKESS